MNYLFWLLVVLSLTSKVNAQDFFSFISPFVGSGLGTPSGGGPFESALGSGLSSGSAGQGAAGAGNPAPSAGASGGANTGPNGGTGAIASQVLSSVLTGGGNTGEQYGNNPFGEFVNLGQTIAQLSKKPKAARRRRRAGPAKQKLGSDESYLSSLEQNKRSRRVRLFRSKLPDFERHESGKTKWKHGKKSGLSEASHRQKRQSNPLDLISAFVPRRASSSPGVSRLADNFGRNFFGFLDELHEYSQMQPDPNAITTSTAPPTLPNLFKFPGAPQPQPFTLAPQPQPFTLAPPFQPIGQPQLIGQQPYQSPYQQPFQPALPQNAPAQASQQTQNPYEFPAYGPSLIASDFGNQAPQTADFLDANNLMRGFLRSMAKAAGQPLRPLPARNDGTEAGRNRPLMDQLFESDILLTSKQMKAIVVAEAEKRQNRAGRRRVKRKVITGGAYRWPKGAPISFSFRESDKEWRQLIIEGLQLWEKETCIRFRENPHTKDRLEFIRGGGCYSSVGKTGGAQKISIGFGCEDKGIVSHEVGHALGFWHEQSRPDRDKYIQLNEKYIAGGTDGNFAKRSDLEADGMGLPYDLGSVMHYGPTAFTLDWDRNTIVTKDQKYQHSIGQRKGPSFIDVKQINRLYCFQTCAGTQVRCENGGYADPNNCQRCKCPPGLGGPSCNLVAQSDSALCGGELQAQPFWQHLTHKGRHKCVWRIRANRARIRLILDKVNYQCDTTCKSYVEIKHNSDFQQIGFRSCCDEANLEVLSEQDEVLIITDPQTMNHDGAFTLRYIQDSGTPLPRPPPPAWVPGRENRAFRGVQNKGGLIEKFILNAIPKVRDPNKPVESVFSIFTDYVASSFLGASRDGKK